MTISIPTAIFDKYHEGMTEIISKFGVDATIYYPPLKINCENCYFTNIAGVSASNAYRPGGPYPFSSPEMCPYCLGLGYKESVESDTIHIRAYFDKKSWSKLQIPIGIKDGDVWTIGHMKDLIKVQRAAYITLPNQNTTANPYTLLQEPIPWGFGKDRYFSAFWQRGE